MFSKWWRRGDLNDVISEQWTGWQLPCGFYRCILVCLKFCLCETKGTKRKMQLSRNSCAYSDHVTKLQVWKHIGRVPLKVNESYSTSFCLLQVQFRAACVTARLWVLVKRVEDDAKLLLKHSQASSPELRGEVLCIYSTTRNTLDWEIIFCLPQHAAIRKTRDVSEATAKQSAPQPWCQ